MHAEIADFEVLCICIHCQLDDIFFVLEKVEMDFGILNGPEVQTKSLQLIEVVSCPQ